MVYKSLEIKHVSLTHMTSSITKLTMMERHFIADHYRHIAWIYILSEGWMWTDVLSPVCRTVFTFPSRCINASVLSVSKVQLEQLSVTIQHAVEICFNESEGTLLHPASLEQLGGLKASLEGSSVVVMGRCFSLIPPPKFNLLIPSLKSTSVIILKSSCRLD